MRKSVKWSFFIQSLRTPYAVRFERKQWKKSLLVEEIPGKFFIGNLSSSMKRVRNIDHYLTFWGDISILIGNQIRKDQRSQALVATFRTTTDRRMMGGVKVWPSELPVVDYRTPGERAWQSEGVAGATVIYNLVESPISRMFTYIGSSSTEEFLEEKSVNDCNGSTELDRLLCYLLACFTISSTETVSSWPVASRFFHSQPIDLIQIGVTTISTALQSTVSNRFTHRIMLFAVSPFSSLPYSQKRLIYVRPTVPAQYRSTHRIVPYPIYHIDDLPYHAPRRCIVGRPHRAEVVVVVADLKKLFIIRFSNNRRHIAHASRSSGRDRFLWISARPIIDQILTVA